MAEFCVKCWEKMNEGTRYKYILGEDFCEGCGKWRRDCVYHLDAGIILQGIQYIKFKRGYYDVEFDAEE